MDDKILNRIKKLFALGSNNSNEHEAESAMKMARKLLDKHNISVYDLKEDEEIGIKTEVNLSMPWTRIVYQSIAELYDVRYLIQKHKRKPHEHLLIGTESNRVTASIVIEFVIKEIKDSCVGMGSGYRNAAAHGVSSQVNRILKERRESTEEVIPGTGLLPVDASKIAIQNANDWIDDLWGKLKKGKTSYHTFNNSGFNLGENINLGAHLSNKKALS